MEQPHTMLSWDWSSISRPCSVCLSSVISLLLVCICSVLVATSRFSSSVWKKNKNNKNQMQIGLPKCFISQKESTTLITVVVLLALDLILSNGPMVKRGWMFKILVGVSGLLASYRMQKLISKCRSVAQKLGPWWDDSASIYLFIGIAIPVYRTRPQHLDGSYQPVFHTALSSQPGYWWDQLQEQHQSLRWPVHPADCCIPSFPTETEGHKRGYTFFPCTLSALSNPYSLTGKHVVWVMVITHLTAC